MTVSVLQICPHDDPPFADLCHVYRLAVESLGCTCTTVILGRASGDAVQDAIYLGQPDLSKDRQVVQALHAALKGEFALAICHRYRAWRTLAKSRVDVTHRIVVAHEFGFFSRAIRRWHARFASRTLFAGVSEAVTVELAAVARQAVTLPNALDVEAMGRELLSAKAALSELGLTEGPLTLGVIGRLHAKKQPALARDGFLAANLPDSRIVFVGDGELAPGLRVDDSQVIFAGFVPRARRLLRAFDAVLLTTGGVEAFGMAALEAMAAGVPVICQRVSGPLEVLGEHGIYYDEATPADVARAIHRFAGDCDSTGARARAMLTRTQAKFSVPALARHLATLPGIPSIGKGE